MHDPLIPSLCACGCGQSLVRAASVSLCHFAKQRYIKGHHCKTPEWRTQQSESTKRAYAEGKMDHAVHQTPEYIHKRTQMMRGRKRTDSARRNSAAAVKKAWADGKYVGSRAGASKEQMNAIRKKVDIDKLRTTSRLKMSQQMDEWKKTGQLDDIRRKAKNLAGMPDHICAKRWNMRSPSGIPYEFTNLAAWAREHTHLFVDDRPESKMPFWKRIGDGLRSLLSDSGKSCSYRGWVAVSKAELKSGGADLLGRDQPGVLLSDCDAATL